MYLEAHALQDMSNCIVKEGTFLHGLFADPKHIKTWQVILIPGEKIIFTYKLKKNKQNKTKQNWERGQMHNGMCLDNLLLSPHLIYYMSYANFSALGVKVKFDQNSNLIAYYDLLNWQRSPESSLH